MHKTNELNIVCTISEHLRTFAHRVSVVDEAFIIANINSLTPIIENTRKTLQDVERDRNLFGRLLMKGDEYRRQFREISSHLHELSALFQRSVSAVTKIIVPDHEFFNFRRKFAIILENALCFYDFSITKNVPHSTVTMIIEGFNSWTFSFYMKINDEQIMLTALTERRKRFQKSWQAASTTEELINGSSLAPINSRDLLPPMSNELPAATTTTTPVDFSEFSFMSHADICGMALTKSVTYITTKFEINVVSLEEKKYIVKYGTHGYGPNKFNPIYISYLFIVPNDATSLYIVDCAQYFVHQYKIDDTGLCFEYVRKYVVIANVLRRHNLVSCIILNGNLFVSDDTNNCLHIFPLKGECQSLYLVDRLPTSFSPVDYYVLMINIYMLLIVHRKTLAYWCLMKNMK
ncbi:unnamed protein product [Rotaria magnacalcarata]